MAEGWARRLGPDWLKVQSAGIEAHGQNPRAVKVMAEAGVDISGQESTMLSDELLAATDFLVTVCGHADEHCPAVPAAMRKEHWPLDDPAKATGPEEQVLAIFRQSRDEIRDRVEELLSRLSNESRQDQNDRA
jgi:arsenate reductase